MLYLIYDAQGQILQSNKVLQPATDWRAYEAQMREFGHNRFIRIDGAAGAAPLDPRKVFIQSGRVRPRGVMPIVQERARIAAGQLAVFRHVPLGAQCSVYAGAAVAESFVVPDRTLELDLGTPGSYRVEFLLFPYMPWTGDLIVESL